MTISRAQYRENSQLRHKWVLSPAASCVTKKTMAGGRDIHPSRSYVLESFEQ